MGVKESKPENKTYTEIFEECFPFYLSIGMTYKEFWEGDVTLPKFYREAEKQRQRQQLESDNFKCWLQGKYFFEALCCASPLLRTSFGKGEIRAHEYRDKPYEFADTPQTKSKVEIEQEKQNLLLKTQISMCNIVHEFKHLPKGGD